MNSRDKYYKELSKKITVIASDKKQVTLHAKTISKKHSIPFEQVTDLLTLRVPVSISDDTIAYALGEEFDVPLDKYFSKDEITKLSKWKYKAAEFKFPIEFNMVQVNDQQWTGKITVAELMKLRDSQIINYNTNTQRVMKRIVKGNEEFYQVVVNEKAIKSMMEMFKKRIFISNTITLNMPEDTVCEFEETDNDTGMGTLVIKKMEHFDIIDGYHRFLALSELYNLDNTFEYTMELRITNYSEDICRQFIWQEDQKTKMSKIDSNSLNLESSANKVAAKLNADPIFNLSGSINSSGGCINLSEFAEIVRATYFQKSNIFSKQKELQDIIKAEKDLRNGINLVTEEHTELLEKTWPRTFLYSLVYNIYCGETHDRLYDETIRMESLALGKKMFVSRELKRIDMRRLAAIKKGES